jgi:hypothetical protein
MPAIFDLLYFEYCRARLAEMRKQLLIAGESPEALQEECGVAEIADHDGVDKTKATLEIGHGAHN